MRELILHVGYPKTATTFLQTQVFPEFSALGRASRQPGSKPVDRELKRIALNERACFWQSAEAKQFLDRLFSVSRSNPVLVSDENWLWGPRLLSPPQKPGWRDTAGSIHPLAEHMRQLGQVLLQLYGCRLKVLLTCRNQANYIGSFYAQCANRYEEKADQGHFMSLVARLLETPGFEGSGFLEYHRLYEDLLDATGGYTCILLQEQIAEERFWRNFAEFTGLRPGLGVEMLRDKVGQGKHTNRRSLSSGSWRVGQFPIPRPWMHLVTSLLSPANPVLRGQLLLKLRKRLDPWFRESHTIVLDAATKGKILERYQSSNEKLAAMTGVDLDALGYLPTSVAK